MYPEIVLKSAWSREVDWFQLLVSPLNCSLVQLEIYRAQVLKLATVSESLQYFHLHIMYFHTDINSDFTVSSESVSFSPAAADGVQMCITVTALCDDIAEEDEAVQIAIPSSSIYVRNTSGVEFSAFETIHFTDGSG